MPLFKEGGKPVGLKAYHQNNAKVRNLLQAAHPLKNMEL